MGRRDTGWIYTGTDPEGIDLYIGKHDGPNPYTRIAEHHRRDAEWTRHAEELTSRRVHRDDLDFEEQTAIKAANDGDGTVFNLCHNRRGWADRYRGGHSTREAPDERPDHNRKRDRRARGGDHPSYVAWQERESKRRGQ
jgi:hypothetical protein